MALFVIARSKGVAFRDLIGNNNWVFCATLTMTLVSMLIAFKNPYVPPTMGRAHNPYAEDALLGRLNHFYFGETLTHGWRTAAWIYFLLTIIAVFVSFTDDLVDSLKGRPYQSG